MGSQEKKVSAAPPLPLPGVLLVSVLSGLVFGSCLFLSGVNEATVLRGQFDFRNLVMLKIFLAAAGMSTITITAVYLYSNELCDLVAGDSRSGKGHGLVSTVIGTFLLGVGMTMTGSCPGTVWSQLGAGSVKAWGVITSGLVAAWVFGATRDSIFGSLCTSCTIRFEKSTIDRLCNQPRELLGFGFGAAMVSFSFFLNYLKPWEDDIDPKYAPTYNPSILGLALGSLQVVLMFLVRKTLGSSSSYVTVAANIFGSGDSSYLGKYKSASASNLWQVTYLVGAALAAFYWSQSTGRSYRSDDDVAWWHAIVGGFLLVFGARLANGCTSGHGISGIAHLDVRSAAGICAMFGGAIVTKVFIFPEL